MWLNLYAVICGNDNLNTPGSRTASSDEQYGTNLRRGLARDLGKWFAEVLSCKPSIKEEMAQDRCAWRNITRGPTRASADA